MEEKTYTVYIHRVVTDDNGPMYYVGVTCQKLYDRWKPSAYKGTALWYYIEQYNWKNIEHTVVYETDDREKALKIEDMLICGYAALGRRINKQRSGHIEVSDPSAYLKILFADNPEYLERRRKQNRQYRRDRYANDSEYVERQRQYHRDRYANDPEYAERRRQLERDRRLTPEGKIYTRVYTFNRNHPDLAIESPLEARDNYRKYHIVPKYIKHDDL